MKIVAWVPIKMNNERLPGKNTLPLGGKPLCQHVISKLLEIKKVDETCVFCSEEDIINFVPEGVRYVPRDSSLNSFSTKINDVIKAFTDSIDADIYIYAQVTSPFLTKETIEEGLEAVLSGKYDSALSVKRLRDFLWKDGLPINYDPANIARTQDLEPYYQETGGFYIYKKELVCEHNRRTGFSPYFAEVNETEAVDIDYREDYELAQSIMLKNQGSVIDSHNASILIKWLKLTESGISIKSYFERKHLKGIAIYGAGVIGRLLHDILDRSGICVKYYIDTNESDTLYQDTPYIQKDSISKQEPVSTVVITPGYDSDLIYSELTSAYDQETQIVTIDEILNRMEILSKIMGNMQSPVNRKQLFSIIKDCYNQYNDGYEISESTFDKCINELITYISTSMKFSSREHLINRISNWVITLLEKKCAIPLIDLVVTTKCSLKCKKCFHLIPYYSKNGNHPFDIDVNEIKKDLNHLLSSVDFVQKINILGGEPFLYESLKELLEYVSQHKNVGYFNIISNGTIVPSDDICKLLSNDCFVVSMSRYGKYSIRVDECIEQFRRFGVTYTVSENKTWFDFGDLEYQNLTEEKLAEAYKSCTFSKCKALMLGEIHTCAFDKHGQKNGLLPLNQESLHIHNFTTEELKNEITNFYRRDYFSNCNYCNAPNNDRSKRIVAGEQE